MSDYKQEYDMPIGWTWATIEELVDGMSGVFIDGDWIETKDQDPNGKVRLIQLADVGDGLFRNRSDRFMTDQRAVELNCTFLKKSDILVARMPDPLGRACLFPFDEHNQFVTVVDVAIIRTGENGISNKLLLNFINSPIIRKEIERLQTGTTRKRISRGNLAMIKFPIPPINEQQRIVSKIEELFSDLDNGIANLKRAQNQLKVYRQALLKSAFEGKLTEQWRKENNPESAEKLLERIKDERKKRYEQELKVWKDAVKLWEKEGNKGRKPVKPKEYKGIEKEIESSTLLDEIPNNWKNCKLGNIFEIFVGATPSRKNTAFWTNGNIHWVSSGEVKFNRINNTKEKITKYGLENTSTSIHPIGTVMMAMIGDGKTRGQAAILKVPACHNQNTAAIRVSDIGLNPDFLFYYLELNYQRNRDLGSGNSQKALNRTLIQNLNYPLCSVNEQDEVTSLLDSNISTLENLQNTITTSLQNSEVLRQSILKKAFEGKLVAQDPIDEPASELLKRIKAEKKKYLEEQKEQKKSTPKKIKKMSKELSIEEVLKTSDKPMLAKDVWQQSKHKENIEDFYAELKKIQSSINEVKKGSESLLSLVK